MRAFGGGASRVAFIMGFHVMGVAGGVLVSRARPLVSACGERTVVHECDG